MLLRGLLVHMLLMMIGCASAQSTMTWHSDALGRDLVVSTELPAGATAQPASRPAVIVLKNLLIRPADDAAKARARSELIADGCAVVEIDYKNDPGATIAALVKDLLKIRSDLKEEKLALDPSIDINRIWIIPEGYALKRNITFYRNQEKTWQLDIAYPIDAKEPAATVMEITCDNASRMGNFSLVYCRDTLLEGALFRGFAAAMIDHPVPAPYKGLDDPMPELIHRLKAAVRTIRAQSGSLKLNGRIGALGFSRGGPMAAFLAVTNGRAEFDVGGEHLGVSSDVQAALVHGNRYDYSALRADDPMLSRFEGAWGPLATNAERWHAHGAAYYLRDTAAPVFLNTSDTESAEYRDGLLRFHELLIGKGAKHVLQIDADGRGHQVSTDPNTLLAIYQFLSHTLTSDMFP